MHCTTTVSGMWHHVVRYIGTNKSEEAVPPTTRVEETRLHSVISQKTVILIFTAMRNPNLAH
jgi:hypothetical protein